MKSRTLGLALLSSASLLAFSGCVSPPGDVDEADDETDVATEKAPLYGAQWGLGTPIAGAYGIGTPALGIHNNRLHMVYHGLYGNNLYMSSLNNGAWGNPFAIPNIRSRVTPALTPYGNRLMMVYPHSLTNRYRMSFYDGNGWSPGEELGEAFAGHLSPALTYYGGRAHMVYRGGGNQLYGTWYDGHSWANPFAIAGAYSRVTPSLGVYGGRLNLVYPSLYNNNLAVVTHNGYGWGSPTLLPNLYSPWSPGLGVYNNTLAAIYPTGSGAGWGGYGGYGLDWTLYDGNAWGPGSLLPGFQASYAPSLANYGNNLHMVYPGVNNQLYWSSCCN